MTSDQNDDTTQHPTPVVVGVYSHAGEAEIALAHLRSAGIKATLWDDTEGGVMPIEGQDGIGVMVQPDDAEVARALLKPEDSTGDDSKPDDGA